MGCKNSDYSITEKMADFACSLSYRNIPELARTKARYALIDMIGCIVGAQTTKEAAMIDAFVEENAGRGTSTVIGTGKLNTVSNAAMANAYKCHILEFDDGVGGIHTGATILPAAVAMAEKTKAEGQELIRAIVLGLEMGCRTSLAAGISHQRYWHSTATCGTFGAAMAAGVLLGLSREKLVWALGNAGTMAAGLWEFNVDGAMTKYLHCAKAAENGIQAALLAAGGLTGPRRILEGEYGFIPSHSTQKHPEHFFETLGEEWIIDKLCVKPYPACSHTHAAISAALWLKSTYEIDPSDIEEITVTTYEAALATARHNRSFDTPQEARLSITCSVAAAFLHGRVDVETYMQESLADMRLRRLAEKIRIQIDPAMSRAYPAHWAAAVEVRFAGRQARKEITDPWGDLREVIPENILQEKFRGLVKKYLPEEKAAQVWHDCLTLGIREE